MSLLHNGAHTVELLALDGRRIDSRHGAARGEYSFANLRPGVHLIAVTSPAGALIATAIQLRNGSLIFAGQARTVLVSPDGGRTLATPATTPTTAIAELIELRDGSLLALGEAGATVIPASQVTPPAPATR